MSAASSESPADIEFRIVNAGERAIARDTEGRYYYSTGNLYPVEINTKIGTKKGDRILHVINKLGQGSYGTVWLVEDTKPPANAPSRWKALKMHRRGTTQTDLDVPKMFKRAGITPEEALTKYQIAIPYEQFPIRGGEGGEKWFICSVLPLLGPRVDNNKMYSRDPNSNTRRVACRQIAEALQKLHNMGFAHGDFRPANILYYLPHLDKLSLTEIMQVYGKPRAVNWKNPKPLKEPDHLVFPATCNITVLKKILARKNLDLRLVGQPGLQVPRATVIDMGACWHHSWKPRDGLVPLNYQAPECIIRRRGHMSMQSDIWALGCSMVDICCGHEAFPGEYWSVDGRRKSNVLAEMEFFIGAIPMAYRNAWKKRIEGRHAVFPTNPAYVGFLNHLELTDWRKRHRRDPEIWSPLHLAVLKNKRMLPEQRSEFLNLLEGIFQWFPDRRMSLEEILRHPFLQVSDEGP